jgi:glycosyltransferase involved in cell wall biosynthesis
MKWVIVSDGSTDGTDEIVSKYAAEHAWIELLRMPERSERHFVGKVHAFNAGYARVKDLDFEVIGNLDADVSFGEDYFASLLPKFDENPQLGIAGTPFKEGSSQYDYRFTSIEHVSGPVQLFRRQCFKDIGGYIPREIGGIDLVAVLTARMRGWETRTFLEEPYLHHRAMGTATQSALLVSYRGGRGDYILGSHPVWEFFRCIYQLTRRPILIGGSLRFVGFFWAMATGVERQVPSDLIRFRRKEQMQRLRDFMFKLRCWYWPIGNPLHARHAFHFTRALHFVSLRGVACGISLSALFGFVLHHPHAIAKSHPVLQSAEAYHAQAPVHTPAPPVQVPAKR